MTKKLLGFVPSKNSDQPGLSPGWSESWLCIQYVAEYLKFLHVPIEGTNQTGQTWVTCQIAGRRVKLLVLSRTRSCIIIEMTKVLQGHSFLPEHRYWMIADQQKENQHIFMNRVIRKIIWKYSCYSEQHV